MVDETAGVVGESQRVLKVLGVTGCYGWGGLVGVVGMGLLVGFFSEAQEDGFFQKLSTFTQKGGSLEKGGFL